MAQLKDTTVTGNLIVSGTVNGRDIATDGVKLDSLVSQIALGIDYINVANTLDLLTLNEEKTLFTVPTGKQAMIGSSQPVMTFFFSEYSGTSTTDGIITISYYTVEGVLT